MAWKRCCSFREWSESHEDFARKSQRPSTVKKFYDGIKVHILIPLLVEGEEPPEILILGFLGAQITTMFESGQLLR